jgi:aspartate aminotransferase-like enzyme
MTAYSSLLDLPAFPPDRYAALADRLKALLSTRNDVVFVQAEAILALEAAATSLGAPGRVAVNIVTSAYGHYFGDWLRRAGTTVHTVEAEAGRPITAEAVRASLDAARRVDLIALVHAETSSGILNPLPAVAALAHARDALLVVDAVASVGGHRLDVDDLGIDVCVIGPQKALGGPAGLAAVSVSPRAWEAMSAPVGPSNLSLLDLKRNWIDRGRGAVPGMPSALEFWALDAALERVELEGLEQLIRRHEQAALLAREALSAVGIEPWVRDFESASTLVTAVPVPVGVDAAALLETARGLGAAASAGMGNVQGQLIRLDHTGPGATTQRVLSNVFAFAGALQLHGSEVRSDTLAVVARRAARLR